MRTHVSIPALVAVSLSLNMSPPVLANEPPSAAAGPLSKPTGETAPTPLTGRVFSDVYIPIRTIEDADFRYAGVSAWLELGPKLGETTSAWIVLQADSIDTSLSGSTFRAIVREGFVEQNSGGTSCKIRIREPSNLSIQ